MFASVVYLDWDPRRAIEVWGHAGVSPSSEHYGEATLPSSEKERQREESGLYLAGRTCFPFYQTWAGRASSPLPQPVCEPCSRFLNLEPSYTLITMTFLKPHYHHAIHLPQGPKTIFPGHSSPSLQDLCSCLSSHSPCKPVAPGACRRPPATCLRRGASRAAVLPARNHSHF